MFGYLILGSLVGGGVPCAKCQNPQTLVRRTNEWGNEFKCFICAGGARCPQCKKWYKNSQSLAAHRSQDCGKGAQYQCAVCSGKFTRKYSLKMHLFAVHKT